MKKIAFSTRYGLEQAVIASLKGMTRREDKKLNHPLVTSISEWGIDDKGKAYVTITYSTGLTEDVYPAYQIGETVAIAQAYNTLRWPSVPGIDWNAIVDEVTHAKGWKNKMFVKAKYMPHRIRITDIRVERLQDITDEDSMREGIEEEGFRGEYRWGFYTGFFTTNRGQGCKSVWFNSPRKAFADLIDRISGRGTWERNPWVFVYKFEITK